MKFFLRFEQVASALATWASILFLVVAVSLATYQVTTRFVIGVPSTWSEVITRSAMIWSVFLGIAPTFRYGSMIAMEVVQRRLPSPYGLYLYLLSCGLSILFFLHSVLAGDFDGAASGQTDVGGPGNFDCWVYTALPVGAAFAVVAILGCAMRAWQARDGAAGSIAPLPGETQ